MENLFLFDHPGLENSHYPIQLNKCSQTYIIINNNNVVDINQPDTNGIGR